jgi:hypothetical protein
MYTIADMQQVGRALRLAMQGYQDVAENAHKRVVGRNVVVWKEYNSIKDFLFRNLQDMLTLWQKIQEIQNVQNSAEASYNYFMIFPLKIKRDWIAGVITFSDQILLTIIDPLNVLAVLDPQREIISTFTDQFNKLLESQRTIKLHTQILTGNTRMPNKYSGVVVLDILHKYFTAGEYIFDPNFYTRKVISGLLSTQNSLRNEFGAHSLVDNNRHSSSTRQIIGARFPHINMDYTYTAEYLWSCLEANLLLQRPNGKPPPLSIDNYGILRLPDSTAYQTNGSNVVICRSIDNIAATLQHILHVERNQAVQILLPISINERHWSVLRLDIIPHSVHIMVHDTMYRDSVTTYEYFEPISTKIKAILARIIKDRFSYTETVLAAGIQPDTTSAGVLTVAVILRYVFDKSISDAYTLEYVAALRAMHDRLVPQPEFKRIKVTSNSINYERDASFGTDRYQKVQITTIPGYMFFGDVKQQGNYTLVNGIEVISFPNDYQKLSTYSGGFFSGKRAWHGNELNQVPELNMCTVFQGERDINGIMRNGFIKCVLGQAILGIEDTFLTYEGLIEDGLPHGYGVLSTHSAQETHLVAQGEFNRGNLPAVLKKTLHPTILVHFQANKTNLNMLVDPQLREHINKLRQQATNTLDSKLANTENIDRSITFSERSMQSKVFINTAEDQPDLALESDKENSAAHTLTYS